MWYQRCSRQMISQSILTTWSYAYRPMYITLSPHITTYYSKRRLFKVSHWMISTKRLRIKFYLCLKNGKRSDTSQSSLCEQLSTTRRTNISCAKLRRALTISTWCESTPQEQVVVRTAWATLPQTWPAPKHTRSPPLSIPVIIVNSQTSSNSRTSSSSCLQTRWSFPQHSWTRMG